MGKVIKGEGATRHREREPELQAFIDVISNVAFGRTLTQSLEREICVGCGKKAKEFKDDISRKEYAISGLCQPCQDTAFGSGSKTLRKMGKVSHTPTGEN